MSKRIKIFLLVVSTLMVLFTVAGGLGVRASGGDGAYRQLQVYDEVLTRIRSEYVEEPNMTQVTDGALHGLLESLDANSSYLTPAEYKSYKEHKASAKAREAVKIPPASFRMMDDGVGYIKVDALPKGMSQEIATQMKSVQRAGAKKLVLDLRNVSEGEESEGIALADLFLSKGTITYLQGQKYPRENFTADPQKTLWTGPLVVLVNRGTAGAAEIAAAAILDNARGDVVGDKTFGVGSVQKLIEIPDGSALILSVAKYYSPSGKAIQDAAVTPNVVVADASDDSVSPDDDNAAPEEEPKKEAPKEDLQLQKALETLKKGAQKAEMQAPATAQQPAAATH
jgi:carboxyl-terminal processing protease